MTIKEKYGENWKDVPLYDNESPFGGIAFAGETLGDFIEDEEITEQTSLEEINEILRECGIASI